MLLTASVWLVSLSCVRPVLYLSQSGSPYHCNVTPDRKCIIHFDGILNLPHTSLSRLSREGDEIRGHNSVIYSLWEGKQTGAIKRGYDHKRQFYILVITLRSLSDTRVKSGRAKLMLFKWAYLNINGVLAKERSFPTLRQSNKRARSNHCDRNVQ